jgi:hypothetical protein
MPARAARKLTGCSRQRASFTPGCRRDGRRVRPTAQRPQPPRGAAPLAPFPTCPPNPRPAARASDREFGGVEAGRAGQGRALRPAQGAAPGSAQRAFAPDRGGRASGPLRPQRPQAGRPPMGSRQPLGGAALTAPPASRRARTGGARVWAGRRRRVADWLCAPRGVSRRRRALLLATLCHISARAGDAGRGGHGAVASICCIGPASHTRPPRRRGSACPGPPTAAPA